MTCWPDDDGIRYWYSVGIDIRYDDVVVGDVDLLMMMVIYSMTVVTC